MQSLFKTLVIASVGLVALSATSAKAGDIDSALQSEIRTADDKARDTSRSPAETLAFFEVNPSSKVLELMPGGGWYTKILGTLLKEKGALYLTIGANPDRLKLEKHGLTHVKIVGSDISLSPTPERGIYKLDGDQPADFGVNDLDNVLTFRNWHNLDQETRLALNKAAFNALKSGGVYGVIDHTKRHMQPFDAELWRRLDPVQMIKEIQSVGFVFEDYSNIHARPNDGLIYDSTHESINRDSDRFTLKFRKP